MSTAVRFTAEEFDRVVESDVFEDRPSKAGYRLPKTFGVNETISPLAEGDAGLSLEWLFTGG